MPQTVALLGVPGSFSDSAANALFPDSITRLRTTNFRDIFQAVLEEKAEYGIIPVENVLAGSVHENFDLLGEYPLYAVKEYYEPLELSLLGTANSISEVTLVLSHAKAIEQCKNFFQTYPHIKASLFSDTGGAAKYVSEIHDRKMAAIASPKNSQIYGLPILASAIQDESKNFTRFLVLSKTKEEVPGANKYGLQFLLPHTPGALLKVLEVFCEFGFNLTKIESRPVKQKQFEYKFFVDLAGDAGKHQVLQEKLQAVTIEPKVYGIYKAATY